MRPLIRRVITFIKLKLTEESTGNSKREKKKNGSETEAVSMHGESIFSPVHSPILLRNVDVDIRGENRLFPVGRTS